MKTDRLYFEKGEPNTSGGASRGGRDFHSRDLSFSLSPTF
jgi:hypothetical protein